MHVYSSEDFLTHIVYIFYIFCGHTRFGRQRVFQGTCNCGGGGTPENITLSMHYITTLSIERLWIYHCVTKSSHAQPNNMV